MYINEFFVCNQIYYLGKLQAKNDRKKMYAPLHASIFKCELKIVGCVSFSRHRGYSFTSLAERENFCWRIGGYTDRCEENSGGKH